MCLPASFKKHGSASLCDAQHLHPVKARPCVCEDAVDRGQTCKTPYSWQKPCADDDWKYVGVEGMACSGFIEGRPVTGALTSCLHCGETRTYPATPGAPCKGYINETRELVDGVIDCWKSKRAR